MKKTKLSHWVSAFARLIVAISTLVACNSASEDHTYDVDLEPTRPVPERAYVDVSLEPIATLGTAQNHPLYAPIHGKIHQGKIYVPDFGESTVEVFSHTGEHLYTSGNGPGQGPGEWMELMDIEVLNDSLYVLDSILGRLSVFDDSGSFVRSEILASGSKGRGNSIYRYQRSGSMEYWLPSPSFSGQNRFLRMSASPDSILSRSLPFQNLVHPIAAVGKLEAWEDKVIYAPSHFPFLMSFSPEDTLGTLYPTPDYGRYPPGQAQVEGEPGRMMYRPPKDLIHSEMTLDGDVLAVQISESRKDTLEFDLYDVGDMRYMHSIRVPVKRTRLESSYAYHQGLLTSVQDTLVHVYRVTKQDPVTAFH